MEIMNGKENLNKLVAALKLDGDDIILEEYKETPDLE